MDILKLQSEAEAGSADAQSTLGVACLEGVKVPKDYAAALQWFTLAAEQNTPRALFYLGRMHQAGWGVSLDLHKAFEFYQRAAKGKEWLAYIFLARMYRYGRGIPTDEETAGKWYYTAISESKDGVSPCPELDEAIEYVKSL
jgi:uncharacterized protein